MTDMPHMIYGRIRPPSKEPRALFNAFPVRDKAFARRLLASISVGFLGCFLFFLIPAIYFIEQNYAIFTTLAYDVKPNLVEHLEREMLWLRFFLASGTLVTTGVGYYFFRRISQHLLKPLEDVEDHLRSLSQGQWQHPMPPFPTSDTYRTFFISYESFHMALRAQTEAEIQALQKIVVEPAQRDAYMAWQSLLQQKREILGMNRVDPTLNAEESSAVLPFRRVS